MGDFGEGEIRKGCTIDNVNEDAIQYIKKETKEKDFKRLLP